MSLPRPVSSVLLLLVLGACTDTGDKADTGTADTGSTDDSLLDPLESGCVAVEDANKSWTETLTLDSPEATEARLSFTSPMSRGHGILQAEASWEAYAGGPRLGFANAAGSHVATDVYPEDTPSVVAETMVGAGQTVDLLATQFAVASDEDYPVTLQVELQWTPVSDCWEDNSTAAAPVDLPLDTVAEAFLIGSFAPAEPDAFVHTSHDDHYRVRVPEGARTLRIDAAFPVSDGSLAVAVYRLGDDPSFRAYETYAGGSYSSETRLEAEVEPGDYVVFVQAWEGGPFDAWATKSDAGPARPDHWDTPYTLVAAAE